MKARKKKDMATQHTKHAKMHGKCQVPPKVLSSVDPVKPKPTSAEQASPKVHPLSRHHQKGKLQQRALGRQSVVGQNQLVREREGRGGGGGEGEGKGREG